MEFRKPLKEAAARLLPDPAERARTQAEGQLIAATGVALGWQREAMTVAGLAEQHTAGVADLLEQYAQQGILGQLDTQVVQNATHAVLGITESET